MTAREPGLTTHVLDTSRGRPGAGIRVDLSALDAAGAARLLKSVLIDDGGRATLMAAREMRVGRYELRFHVGGYFAAAGTPVTDPPYLDEVPVRFAIAEAPAHYHVPLLVSPFGYTTYRGS